MSIKWSEGGRMIDGEPVAEIIGERAGVRLIGRYAPKRVGAARVAETLRRLMAFSLLYRCDAMDAGTHHVLQISIDGIDCCWPDHPAGLTCILARDRCEVCERSRAEHW